MQLLPALSSSLTFHSPLSPSVVLYQPLSSFLALSGSLYLSLLLLSSSLFIRLLTLLPPLLPFSLSLLSLSAVNHSFKTLK